MTTQQDPEVPQDIVGKIAGAYLEYSRDVTVDVGQRVRALTSGLSNRRVFELLMEQGRVMAVLAELVATGEAIEDDDPVVDLLIKAAGASDEDIEAITS
jgi:hypothetical protein